MIGWKVIWSLWACSLIRSVKHILIKADILKKADKSSRISKELQGMEKGVHDSWKISLVHKDHLLEYSYHLFVHDILLCWGTELLLGIYGIYYFKFIVCFCWIFCRQDLDLLKRGFMWMIQMLLSMMAWVTKLGLAYLIWNKDYIPVMKEEHEWCRHWATEIPV